LEAGSAVVTNLEEYWQQVVRQNAGSGAYRRGGHYSVVTIGPLHQLEVCDVEPDGGLPNVVRLPSETEEHSV